MNPRFGSLVPKVVSISNFVVRLILKKVSMIFFFRHGVGGNFTDMSRLAQKEHLLEQSKGQIMQFFQEDTAPTAKSAGKAETQNFPLMPDCSNGI